MTGGAPHSGPHAERPIWRRLAPEGGIAGRKANFRNLLSGSLARLWAQNSAQRLRNLTGATAGALAQDGGTAMDSVNGLLPNDKWPTLAKEFLLS